MLIESSEGFFLNECLIYLKFPCSLFFFFDYVAGGILVPLPACELMSPVLKRGVLTTRPPGKFFA